MTQSTTQSRKQSALLPFTLATLLFSSQLMAAADEQFQPASLQEAEHERQVYETKGVLSGILLGALAGGPAGAVLSAATGGWLGNKLHEAKGSRTLKAELKYRNSELAALQEANEALQQQLIASQSELQERNLLASTNNHSLQTTTCCSDTEMTLHFRSASSAIEEHYLTELKRFASLAKLVPDATIEIKGHADRRGESAENLALSQQRVKSVEQSLRELGLGRMHFNTSASGERQPITNQDSFESNFFDRRVQVRLVSDQTELLTQHKP